MSYFINMIIKTLSTATRFLIKTPQFGLLNHHKILTVKKEIYGDMNQERGLKLKLKFLWRQTKYTLVQGCKDLWQQLKWLVNLIYNKRSKQFTGYEKAVSWRIFLDICKFVPYSILLAIPLAQVLIPVVVWVFPNAVPSFFLFDTAEDKKIQEVEMLQEEANQFLIEKLMDTLRNVSKNQESFVHYDLFKKEFFEVIEELETKLNFKNFNSGQLIQVLNFLGGNYMTGTATVNKIVNLFTMTIPRFIVRLCRFLYMKATKKKLKPYKDPFWIKGNFRILQFDYFPFEFFKRRFLLFQIQRKFRILLDLDMAFYEHGMDEINGLMIKEFARERGLAPLSCYIVLKNVMENDWLQVTTHPKFTNNRKLWYSVMMYHFMSEANKDLN